MKRMGLVLVALIVLVGCAAALRTNDTVTSNALSLVVKIQRDGAIGSGVIISRKGYIVTNRHVVGDSDAVSVTFRDGREVIGRVLWSSRRKGVTGDLAFIKVDEAQHSARLHCDKPMVGDRLSIVGHPLSRAWTTTWGRVSAMRPGLIQMDATVAPGNSGGPVFNTDGEVVGIAVAVMSFPVLGSMGSMRQILPTISFAVPAKTVCEFLAR